MTQFNIAIASAGEMGAAVGAALTRAGYQVTTYLDGRGAETKARARAANMEIRPQLNDLLSDCTLFLSIVPPAVAMTLANDVAALAKTHDHSFIFVEGNAISPDHSKEIAALFDGSSVTFIDGGIVGAPPSEHSRPRLYISGPPAQALTATDGIAFDIRALGPEIGQASAMKMSYAAITKGVNTLLTAALLAADRLNLLEPLARELQESQAALFSRAEQAIPHLPADAARWVPEMAEIAATFDAVGVPDGFHLGAAKVMEMLAESQYGDETRRTRDTSRDYLATIRGMK